VTVRSTGCVRPAPVNVCSRVHTAIACCCYARPRRLSSRNETVDRGAALGTIIGAIAGGAKGAAIGVLVGAAGGAGAEVLNKGKDVRVPAETLLKFRLDKPVSLQAER
jgi:phage tail tape-measure protein